MTAANAKTTTSPSLVTQGRGRVYDSILDTIGDTPLVRLLLIFMPSLNSSTRFHP